MANIQEEEKAEAQIAKVYTNKLTCVITGDTTQFARAYYEKRVAAAGSEKILHETYCSKKAKSLLQRGFPVSEVRKVLGVSDITTEVPQEILSAILCTTEEKQAAILALQPQVQTTKVSVEEFLNKLTTYVENIKK
jgi:hypothetical protein